MRIAENIATNASVVSEPDAPLPKGSTAPDFTAEAHNGSKISLQSLRGKSVVLYFYPKDDTPGCTAEAKDFRDRTAEFEKAGAVIVGVSTDGNASHSEFADKYGLPFALVSDTDGRLAKAFGVPVTMNFTKRVTFVIDPSGKIAETYASVDVDGHADAVLDVVRSLNPGTKSAP